MASLQTPPGETRRATDSASSLTGPFDDLVSLRIFAKVVELESFSEVARRSGVTPATVSKHIAALEGRLGTRLVNRTTRRLFVTDAGARLYARCIRVLDELQQAQADLSALQSEPIGHLRVPLPRAFGARRIAPAVPRFLKQYPRVTIDLDLSVDTVDVYEAHIDVAIRIADRIDPGLVAVRLAPYSRVFCATPSYLAERGVPRAPDDLPSHECLFSRGQHANTSWPIMQDGKVRTVAVNGRLSSNHGEPVLEAARAGLGICQTARWMVEEDLASGRLVEVLHGHVVQNRAVYAVLSQRGAMTPKVRVFVDFVRDAVSDMR